MLKTEYQREYRAKNRKRLLVYKREWAKANRIAHGNTYYLNNKERALLLAKKQYQRIKSNPELFAKLKERRGKALKKWLLNHPEKHKAHVKVYLALKKGTLKRLNCKVCERSETEAHHPDYTKPLDVVWLCREHHKDIHRLSRLTPTAT